MTRRFSIIQKLFLSYLCLLAPLLLLGFLLTNTFMGRMREDTRKALKTQLDRVTEDFHQRYLSYRDSSVQIYANPELQRYKMLSSSVAAARGIKKLTDLNSYDARVSDVFLYYGDGRAYSAKGLVGARTYFQVTMRCAAEATARALDVLQNADEATLLYLPMEGSATGYLFYHFPVRVYDNPTQGTVSVNHCVRMAMLENLLEPLAKEYPATISVRLPGADEVLFCADVQGGVRQVSPKDFDMASRFATTTVSARAEDLGISISVSYAPEVLYSEMNRIQLLTYIATAAVLLLSVMVSFLLSRRHYLQIRNLVHTVTAADHGSPPPPAKGRLNELEYIQRMLQRMIDDSDTMEQRAAMTRTALRTQAATLLFHGLLKGNAAPQMQQMCGMELHEDYYAIFGFCLRTGEVPPTAWDTLERFFDGGLTCRMEVGPHGALFALVELPQPDYLRRHRSELARRALGHLDPALTRRGVVAVSQVYESLNMASYAYLEASSILEEAVQNPDMAGEIYWESLAKTKAGTQKLPEEEIQRLEQSLQQGDEATVLSSFTQLMKTIDRQAIAENARQSLRLRVLQPVLLACRQQADRNNDQLLAELLRLDPTDRERFDALMGKLIKRLCQSTEKKDDFERIIAYIEANYFKFDLSLDQVSGYAGLSKTYLSKLFKVKTNCRYIDYLTQLRMQEARRLILETDLSIKDIVEKVGYLDAAGFRKKFKATFGVNAAELRKKRSEEMDAAAEQHIAI